MTSDRPLIHFTPRFNWLNDPNGLVFHRGRYHLFYQYNPIGAYHGNMSWGHASSPDLLEWEEHPVAISFDDDEQVYSGSAVVDRENSSGLAASGALVAVYTSARGPGGHGHQAQSLAYSVDDGMTWTKYAGNPVLDRGSAHFRDPKVFRYGSEWIMVVVEADDRRVLFYRSDDLKDWTYLSSYGPAGAVGGVWECPDLFPLPLDGDPDNLHWVLLVSLFPGGVAGGSGTQYVVGRFDGVRFTPDADVEPVPAAHPKLATLDWLDGGRDCYAGVTFNGLSDDERIFIAWMNNWDYARNIPTQPWSGAMTVPRRLDLVTADGRPQLRAHPLVPQGTLVEQRFAAMEKGAVDTVRIPVAARIDLRARVEGELVARIDAGGDQHVTLRHAGRRVTLDRRAAGTVHHAFGSIESVDVPGDPGLVDLTIILDTGSIEVFVGGGLRTITDLMVLGSGERRLTLEAVGGAIEIEEFTVRDLAEGDD